MNCPSCPTPTLLVPKTLPSADKYKVHEHLVCPTDQNHKAYCITQRAWVR